MERRLWSVEGNTQRLDGGAMFGNVPRTLWSEWAEPDARHRISLACRALLIEESGGRRILAETGIGAFFAPAMRDRFGVVEARHVLLDNLERLGFSHESIDVVVLSHLHFDHAGGLLTPYEEGVAPGLLFPRAEFVVGREAWARAQHPHPRDRASYIAALAPLLEASGRLRLFDGTRSDVLGPAYTLHRSDGHTPGLSLLEVPMPGGPVVFAADLIPGRPWVHLPVTMGYDRAPELLIDEKTALLNDLLARNGRLFFTHDPAVAMGAVHRDAKGRFGCDKTYPTLEAWSE
ncbi:MAG: MBL fold metallo-hydrolase [Myxococcales bacterium]|nr:MBL fold metallo-hydrolase [Myxococcales bacterium]